MDEELLARLAAAEASLEALVVELISDEEGGEEE